MIYTIDTLLYEIMDLKDFIRDTLKDIIDGTLEAQAYASNKGACINPDTFGTLQNPRNIVDIGEGSVAAVQPISFDLCVEESKVKGGKGGIEVVSLNTERSSQTMNKVKFSIAMVLPTMPAPSRFRAEEI